MAGSASGELSAHGRLDHYKIHLVVEGCKFTDGQRHGVSSLVKSEWHKTRSEQSVEHVITRQPAGDAQAGENSIITALVRSRVFVAPAITAGS